MSLRKFSPYSEVTRNFTKIQNTVYTGKRTTDGCGHHIWCFYYLIKNANNNNNNNNNNNRANRTVSKLLKHA